MKSKSTSSFDRNFLFNACMAQNETRQNNQRPQPTFNTKNKKKMTSPRTLGKPVSMNDLQINIKPKLLKKQHTEQPNKPIIIKDIQQKNVINPYLPNSLHNDSNQMLQYENLIQSQHSRKSRYEGNKIKIFSNDNSKGSIHFNDDKGKSLSKDSYGGTSASRQKRGIQVTKTLLKKISGMYSDQDFGRNSQSLSNRSSCYQRNHKKVMKDSINNQTGFMMTTWDSQRTFQEYQLSREYDSINKTGNDPFSIGSYGKVGGLNTLNTSQQSNRILTDLSKFNSSYCTNQNTQYSMRNDNQRHSNRNSNQRLVKNSFNQPRSANSIKIVESSQIGSSSQIPLPIQYQQKPRERPSYHIPSNPNQVQSNKKLINSSNSKGKMFSKGSNSKIFSSTSSHNLNRQNQKRSLMFSKSKEIPKLTTNINIKNALFDTAHQILSQQNSSLNPGFSSIKKFSKVSGEQLTNLIYGNKDNQKRQQQQSQQERQKYVLRYKNKTLEDLSLKQSMVEGYDNYYK